MSGSDPRRLELDTSPPLRDALTALRGDGPSPAELGRISERLSPLLDAEGAAGGGWGAGKLLRAGAPLLAVVAGVAWLAWGQGQAERLRPTPSAPAAQRAAPASDGRGVPATGRAEQGVTAPMPRLQPQPEPAIAAPSASPTEGPVPSSRRRRARTRRAPVVLAAPALDAADPVREEAAPAGPLPPASRASEPIAWAASSANGAAAGGAPGVERVAPPRETPLSEAALLHKARRIAPEDPRAALALLEQHERRFAAGMLVQERELLAVELLRAVGRDGAARSRMQAFRARYPDSIYLQRGRAQP